MRNIFKKVYCQECEHCILASRYSSHIGQLEFARCMMDKQIKKHVYVSEPVEYNYCSITRYIGFKFCFKFKEKINEAK